MTPRARDAAERLLRVATAALPARRAEWGAAMRAELAAIDDTAGRRRFARSAAAAAIGGSYGICLVLAATVAVFVAGATLTASRVQLHDGGGPGVLGVTVPVPAVPLLLVALFAARTSRSFRFGVAMGVLALVASLGAVFTVLAVEGPVWMGRYGVFMLDGDPPRQAVGSAEIVLDLFSTGMWIGHVAFWLPWLLIGAALGARLGPRPLPAVDAETVL